MELIESQGQNPDGRSWRGGSKLSHLVMAGQLLEVANTTFALVSESGCCCLLFSKRVPALAWEGSRVTILTIPRLTVDHVGA